MINGIRYSSRKPQVLSQMTSLLSSQYFFSAHLTSHLKRMSGERVVEASKASSSLSSRAESLRVQGNDAFRENRLAEAKALYTEAIALDARLFSNRSLVFSKLEEHWGAFSDATHATDIHPRFTKAWIRTAIHKSVDSNGDCSRKTQSSRVGVGKSHTRRSRDARSLLKATRQRLSSSSSSSSNAGLIRR